MMLTGLVRRRLAVAADALLGSEVFTKLPATKTVLCVVATSGPPAALGLAHRSLFRPRAGLAAARMEGRGCNPADRGGRR